MRAQAQAFLEALDETQRGQATYAFADEERFRWQYTPGPRGGLALADMDDRQRELAMTLLESCLSSSGATTARQIMALEPILRDLEQQAGRSGWERRDADFYWFSVFGDPAADEPWGWRVGGHHLCVHVTVAGGGVTVTPLFFGANPARVRTGDRAGLRTLADEEDLARSFVEGLDEEQRRLAVVSTKAPADIVTRNAVRAEIAAVPTGIAHDRLQPAQQAALARLVGVYTSRVDLPSFVPVEGLTFAWAGSLTPGQGHYYALRNETVLIEYDNTQDGANHIHTVWRDLRRDWGSDLLAEHYARSHR